MPNSRAFLFLQGPLSPFFRRLGAALRQRGHAVYRVNMCGGDVFHWWRGGTLCWRGRHEEWPQWVGDRMQALGITDMVLLGDWRPLHREAVLLARQRGVRVWVFEEGYLRPNYLTLEEGGVNAASPLPRDPDTVRALAAQLRDREPAPPSRAENPMWLRVASTAWNHVGNVLLWPFFHRFRTHRPYCIGHELLGLIPRWFMRRRRYADSQRVQRHFYSQNLPYYFMPLQLDADSQIRRHSPFSGILESLAVVITDFAKHAPSDACLLIKNHPLDNGLLNYRRYVRSLGAAVGCSDRLRFLEGVRTESLIRRCRAVVLCNSTVGLSALKAGKPVYCLGDAVYALPGLAASQSDMPLARFWTEAPPPDSALLEDFLHVLRMTALIPGNFYSAQGMADAIAASLRRLIGEDA